MYVTRRFYRRLRTVIFSYTKIRYILKLERLVLFSVLEVNGIRWNATCSNIKYVCFLILKLQNWIISNVCRLTLILTSTHFSSSFSSFKYQKKKKNKLNRLKSVETEMNISRSIPKTQKCANKINGFRCYSILFIL